MNAAGIKSSRESLVLDVGSWELRIGAKVDRIYEIPWYSVESAHLRDLVCDVLDQRDPEAWKEAVRNFIGENYFMHALAGTYIDKESKMHTFVAVWDAK